MATHKCFALRCDKQVPMNMLMCLSHWRKVKPNTQAAVYRTYQEGKKIGDPDRDDAVSNAVAEVAFAEGITSAEWDQK